jgi:uncharacterized protein (DUF342 family)
VIQLQKLDEQLEIQVAVDTSPLTLQDIRQAMQQAGYGRFYIHPDEVNLLLADYLKLQAELASRPNLTVKRVIAERRPASIELRIAPDKMSATAQIIAAWGGAPVSANDVVKTAQQNGVTFGFVKEAIVRLVTEASRAEPGTPVAEVVALGRPMQPGLNAHFESLIDGVTARGSKPVQVSESRVDLRDFGVLPSVAAGEPILRRLPPTKGIDGVNVLGEVTLATPGIQLEFAPGEGTEISPVDPDVLLASREGMPRMQENGAIVDEVYAVKTVDLSTGHVQFRGAVVVNGDVTESMKVIAGGSVFVKGIMEGALIEAGGDVQIGGAIIGHQMAVSSDDEEALSTVVRAGGDVRCNLAQYARIVCQGDLHAVKQINHCQVDARAVFAGAPDKLLGKIVGGRFYLASGLKAGSIGSPSESTTLLNLNRAVDPVADKQQALRDNIQAIRQEMEQIRAAVEQLKQAERSDAVLEQIKYLAEDFEAQKTIVRAIQEDIKLLEAERQARLAEVLVLVKQQLFVGTEFLLGQETVAVRRELGPSRLNWQDGKILLEPWVAG